MTNTDHMAGYTSPPPASETQRRWCLWLMSLAVVVITLDTTIANVALPHIQGTLSTTQDQLAWVLTSYIIANAIFMPLSGYLCDRHGHRRVMVPAVFAFTLTSMLCGMAQSLEELVVFRFLQGISGSFIIPASQALMLTIYSREEYTKALTIWSAGSIIGPILGPSLGGYLTEFFSWRWVFLINLPIGLVVTVGMFLAIPKTALNYNRRMDLAGFTLLGFTVACLQLVFDRGEGQGWFNSWEILIEAWLAVVFLLLFTVHIRGARSPYLRFECFLDRNFAIGMVFMFSNCMVLFASMALLPGYIQNLLDFPVSICGLLLIPRGIGTLVALVLINRIGGRIDPRPLIACGLVASATSLSIMANFHLQANFYAIILSGLIQGFGLSMVFVPNNLLAFSTLSPHLHPDGSAIIGLVRSVAGSLGISTFFTLLIRNTQIHHAQIVESVTQFDHWFNFPDAWDWNTTAGALLLNEEVTRQAAMNAYTIDFTLMKWVTLASLLLLIFASSKRQPALQVATEGSP